MDKIDLESPRDIDTMIAFLLDEKMKACDEASFLYTQEVERRLALEEGEKRGEKRGIAIGEKRGIDKGKIEVARNMKASGMSIESIMQLTGLTRDTIASL